MLRVKATGSIRNVAEEWGVNFGPLSDVDAEIPGSGGLTLRALAEAGEIPADCFEEVEPATEFFTTNVEPEDEPAEERE